MASRLKHILALLICKGINAVETLHKMLKGKKWQLGKHFYTLWTYKETEKKTIQHTPSNQPLHSDHALGIGFGSCGRGGQAPPAQSFSSAKGRTWRLWLLATRCLRNLLGKAYFYLPGAPKTMKNKGFHLQKTWLLGTKNKVFDGFGGSWYILR